MAPGSAGERKVPAARFAGRRRHSGDARREPMVGDALAYPPRDSPLPQ
jgi:hypothetical protein